MFLVLSASSRCFCKDCLDILVDKGTFEKLKDVDPWSCFMCKPSQCGGNLRLRPEWSVKVQDFFVNNSAMEFVSSTHLSLLNVFHTKSVFKGLKPKASWCKVTLRLEVLEAQSTKARVYICIVKVRKPSCKPDVNVISA